MKALTVQQPWTIAAFQGWTRVFVEPFAPEIRGYFLIHAGLGWDFEYEVWLESRDMRISTFAKRSAILGYARLTSVLTKHPTHPHPRRPGHFALEFTDLHPIAPPVLAVGRRGFWPVPDRIMEQLDLPPYVIDGAL